MNYGLLIGETAVVTVFKANVRSRAGIDDENTIEALDQFTLVKVADVSYDSGKNLVWYEISGNGNRWVSERVCAVVKPDPGTLYGLLNSKTLNVRSDPNPKANVVGHLSIGDIVRIENVLENEWMLVENPKATGFVHGRYIEIFNLE